MPDDQGLSPPTRGSHATDRDRVNDGGSIPAHAGEPQLGQRRRASARVYPRPRGGAGPPWRCAPWNCGLSPPTRGSRRWRLQHVRAQRSIPAHAGEPGRRPGRLWPPEVYPRPRGGAELRARASKCVWGLSPPTRGSPHSLDSAARWSWSIPAHAGEPHPSAGSTPRPAVYPRPRGGAVLADTVRLRDGGLSPPTRGSRARVVPNAVYQGSIPAHAGEPEGSARTIP